MKIKRFFAEDMRQAIRKVGKDLGPDAVILSNKKVLGGVEVVAAIDVDESVLKQHAALKQQPNTLDTVAAAIPALSRAPNDAASLNALEAEGAEPLAVSVSAQAARRDENMWPQEPALLEIRSELNDLRKLLERQLAGLAWGDAARRHPLRAKLLRALIEIGLSRELAQQICEKIPDDMAFPLAWRRALELLSASITVAPPDMLDHGGLISLVGPTGVGKTTTIAKLAARYALRYGGKRIALVTMDNYRIGAHEQLRTYGRIMDIPVYTVKNAQEMRSVMKDLVDKDLVLVDTAGMSPRDQRVAEQFEILASAHPSIKNYLVLCVTTEYTALQDAVQAFKGSELHGCILTKLDETLSLGGALSTVIAHRLPVAFVSDGQRVPEDIHLARANNLVNRAVALAQHHPHSLCNDELFERAMREAEVNVNV